MNRLFSIFYSTLPSYPTNDRTNPSYLRIGSCAILPTDGRLLGRRRRVLDSSSLRLGHGYWRLEGYCTSVVFFRWNIISLSTQYTALDLPTGGKKKTRAPREKKVNGFFGKGRIRTYVEFYSTEWKHFWISTQMLGPYVSLGFPHLFIEDVMTTHALYRRYACVAQCPLARL